MKADFKFFTSCLRLQEAEATSPCNLFKLDFHRLYTFVDSIKPSDTLFEIFMSQGLY